MIRYHGEEGVIEGPARCKAKLATENFEGSPQASAGMEVDSGDVATKPVVVEAESQTTEQVKSSTGDSFGATQPSCTSDDLRNLTSQVESLSRTVSALVQDAPSGGISITQGIGFLHETVRQIRET